MTPKIIFKNLDYICHNLFSCKTKLKHFKFWKCFYWKHDKATLIGKHNTKNEQGTELNEALID